MYYRYIYSNRSARSPYPRGNSAERVPEVGGVSRQHPGELDKSMSIMVTIIGIVNIIHLMIRSRFDSSSAQVTARPERNPSAMPQDWISNFLADLERDASHMSDDRLLNSVDRCMEMCEQSQHGADEVHYYGPPEVL